MEKQRAKRNTALTRAPTTSARAQPNVLLSHFCLDNLEHDDHDQDEQYLNLTWHWWRQSPEQWRHWACGSCPPPAPCCWSGSPPPAPRSCSWWSTPSCWPAWWTSCTGAWWSPSGIWTIFKNNNFTHMIFYLRIKSSTGGYYGSWWLLSIVSTVSDGCSDCSASTGHGSLWMTMMMIVTDCCVTPRSVLTSSLLIGQSINSVDIHWSSLDHLHGKLSLVSVMSACFVLRCRNR